MKFKEAIEKCHVRSAIYRKAFPTWKFAKNHSVPIEERVPSPHRDADDWEEWDPNDEYDISLGAEGG